MSAFRVNSSLSYDSLEALGSEACLYPELMASIFKDSGFRIWARAANEAKATEALALFAGEKDENAGLFKATYVLNPGHGLVFSKRRYPNLESIGKVILAKAPEIDESAFGLFSSGCLIWYLSFKGFDKERPSLFAAIKKLCDNVKDTPALSYFLLGFLLGKTKCFSFNGKPYESLKAFFEAEGSRPEIMANYDFLTMPYCEAYQMSTGKSKRFAFAQSLAKADLSADRDFLAALKVKGNGEE